MVGTLINVTTVFVGTLIGVLLGNRLPERIRETVLNGLGLAVLGYAILSLVDAMFNDWLGARTGEGVAKYPDTLTLQYQLAQGMRYGENPHQSGAFYVEKGGKEASISCCQTESLEKA